MATAEVAPVFLFWLGLAVMLTPAACVAALLCRIHRRVICFYVPRIARIFQEKPLFIIPRGQPVPGAEEVRFPTADGLTLSGCYFKAQRPRRGVIVFGLEFGSTCWSAWPYCEHLVGSGFDVFTFESRNQGQSDATPGYDPLQWVTRYELLDTRAALEYVRGRPDADARGVGFFGISKGAGAGVLCAADDPLVLCCVTDGMFATRTTLLPYMRQWFRIYNTRFPQVLIPEWYYRLVAWIALRQVERERGCRFPSLERALGRLAPRPLLLIHGGQDTYIKPEMARALYECAREPREFWLVQEAKHNQALQTAGDEYRGRVLRFFERHLATAEAGSQRSEVRGRRSEAGGRRSEVGSLLTSEL
jgi:alpha-beta hydrolase superfamily lysophospholipase